MDEINLLPWREQLQIYQNKFLTILLASAILFSLVLLFTLQYLLAQRLTWQEQAVSVLELQLQDLQDDTARNASNEVKWQNADIFSELKASHNLIKYLTQSMLMSEMERIILHQISYQQGLIKLTGTAKSSLDLITYLKNCNQKYPKIKLQINHIHEKNSAIEFELQTKVKT